MASLDHEHFLAEIVQTPDLDDPRLVYADYLEERGDPRAEFIRVQCDLAAGASTPDQRTRLQQREAALLKDHQHQWTQRLPRGDYRAVFRRGFLEHLEINAALFAEHATAFFQAAPLLRSLDLIQAEDALPKLTQTREMARVQSLQLRDRLYAAGLEALGTSQFLSGLRELTFRNNQLASRGARTIAMAIGLYQLRSLTIFPNSIHDDGAQEIAAARNMPHLESLTIFGNQISGIGARTIAIAPRMATLRSLRLWGNQIGDEGAQMLAVNASTTRLQTLDLANNLLSDAGAASLAGSPQLESIDQLDLRMNPIGKEGRRRLRARFGDRVQV